MIELKLNDIIQVDGCIYKVSESKWKNKADWSDKDGKGSGFRISLVKVREKELTELLLRRDEDENKNN